MKASVETIRKWAQQISDDFMHYSAEEFEYIVQLGSVLEYEILPDDVGFIGYVIIKDFDCKKKMNVVILYCKQEYRGRYLRYMMRRIEEIAKQEGVARVLIGDSTSGYKQEKFNNMLEYFGYRHSAYCKEF